VKLVCKSCGAHGGAEFFTDDAEARQCLAIAAGLPGPVARHVLAYLGLFRTPGRTLRWAKAHRLLLELKELVEAVDVRWERKPPRPNQARAWGVAMERIIERPPRRLPLQSHGYLRSMAWEAADDLDRAGERAVEEERLRGHRDGAGSGDALRPEAVAGPGPLGVEAQAEIPPEIREQIRRITGAAGAAPGETRVRSQEEIERQKRRILGPGGGGDAQ